MRIDSAIDRYITKSVIEENNKRSEEHISSDKLTASSLALPMRFQLLKHLGVPQKPKDEYALRKFIRGYQIEDWYVGVCEKTPGLVVEKQKEIEYRGVIGKCDVVMDNDLLDFKVGIISHEIKSVTNMAYKWIHDRGDIGKHYKIQGGFYGLGMNKHDYSLDFIASDDLRVHSVLFETDEIRPEIEQIITNYDLMIKNHDVPDWQVSEKWMNDPKYQNYDNFWATCTEQQFREQLKSIGIEY